MSEADENKLHVIRDVLDKPLVDHRGGPMGVCDGIVFEIRDDQPPRLLFMESGLPTVARRLHPRLERIVRWMGRRFSPRRGHSFRVPLAKVEKFDIELKIRADADKTPAVRWEAFLRKHFTGHIPFSR
jgi:hypothetical protein